MKRLFSISLAVVLALCLSTLAFPANTVMAAGDWYVSPTGDDTTGDGSQGNPWRTITKALSQATSGGTVHADLGNYPENIQWKIAVTIQGSGANVTTISGTDGGAVVDANNLGSSAKLDGFTITNGSAGYGGGIFIYDNSSPTISNCIITGNSASVYGGGILIYDNSSPTIINCLITENSAASGGGIAAFYSPYPTVINSTITGNSATDGGGIASLVYSSPTITNSIIYGNTATGNGPNIYNDSSSTTNVTYSCVGEVYAGMGNISDDPKFVPAADDYHLQSDSPCIDAGTSNDAPSIDLDGVTRPQGDGVDMGAYELPFESEYTVEIDIKPGSDPNSINLDSQGVIPVAILTTDDFDAASVNATTVHFGKEGDGAAPVHYALEDVDYDGDTDMILQFKTQETGIEAGDNEATLTGQTTGGIEITGTDSVRIVPPEVPLEDNSKPGKGKGRGRGNGGGNSNPGQGNNQGGGDDNPNPGQGKGKDK